MKTTDSQLFLSYVTSQIFSHFDWFNIIIYWRTDIQMTSLTMFLVSLLYKTDKFHIAVRLFSKESQKTSKCGRIISDTLCYASCVFLTTSLLLNRCTGTIESICRTDTEPNIPPVRSRFRSKGEIR